MPALAKSYVQRPSFKPHDFLIDKRANEVRYVPSSLVPTETVGNVGPTRLDLHFRYITSESPASKKLVFKGIEIEVGKFTQKILAISFTYDPTYQSLLHGFDEAAKSVRKARGSLSKPSIQKSYELIAEFLGIAKNDFNKPKMKADLENMFLAAREQKRRD